MQVLQAMQVVQVTQGVQVPAAGPSGGQATRFIGQGAGPGRYRVLGAFRDRVAGAGRTEAGTQQPEGGSGPLRRAVAAGGPTGVAPGGPGLVGAPGGVARVEAAPAQVDPLRGGPVRGGPVQAGSVQTDEMRTLTESLAGIRRQEQRLDRYIRRALGGGDFSLQELVAMQSMVYRYAQQVEILSRVVDRVTGSIKQALRTQV